jgi:hypothetical protein
VAVATLVVVVSTAVRSAVADWSQAELAPAEVAWALASWAPRMAFRTLLAQAPGSLHSGDHHPSSLYTMDDLLDP